MIRHASLFSQLIAFFNRNKFMQLVMKHQTERYSKGFKSWNHFIAMLFCQVTQAKSLREISGGLACCMGKLRHLGVSDAPSKSTLSYANKNRSWKLYRDLFYDTLDFCRKASPGKHKFRFKNKLLSLDSTTISLCLNLFPWAEFRRTKGAVKLHLLLDHDGYLPSYAYISNGKKHDSTSAKKFPVAPGSIITMDRGYTNYKLFGFWTALIAMLLIKFLQLKSKFGWSLSNLVAFLRWNLFSYKDLWAWLDKPFETIPEVPPPLQMQLPLKGI